MERFTLFAEPWWVNILILAPFVLYYFCRGTLQVTTRTLIISAIFGIAFGFVEAVVVVYLRAAVGLLPGYGGAFSEISRLSSGLFQQAQILGQLPQDLLVIETFREAATILMLLSIALLTGKTLKEKSAMFFWTFAIWDIFYYAGLWSLVRWPGSLTATDVLFLIPVPWYSQVWFPILVSVLMILSVILCTNKLKRF
jgi:hypothetical protein